MSWWGDLWNTDVPQGLAAYGWTGQPNEYSINLPKIIADVSSKIPDISGYAANTATNLLGIAGNIFKLGENVTGIGEDITGGASGLTTAINSDTEIGGGLNVWSIILLGGGALLLYKVIKK